MDKLISEIISYVQNFEPSEDTLEEAKRCLLDSMACGMYALRNDNCKKMLGPVIDNTKVPNGSRVPGTNYVLDPIKATFNIGLMIRWLDFNDTWLAAEWGHPSDNICAILAVADHLSQIKPMKMQKVLHSITKAYEIQGIIALENSFNSIGLDHVILVKLASAAVVGNLLGATDQQLYAILSNVWVDGQSLRTYRHGNNTSQRKSWAAGDAAARGVQIAWMTVYNQEPGCKNPINAETWGFRDVLLKGKDLKLSMKFSDYVLRNILFKVKFPAEFHAQTSAEAAFILHSSIVERIDEIEKIEINTQESAIRIIDKKGPLHNYADRDHCLQYIVAVSLLYGHLDSGHYTDEFASEDPRIDQLREKMVVQEDKQYSKNYSDPDKRAISNSIQIFFKDGTSTSKKEIHFPLGHKKRRDEAEPYLKKKYTQAITSNFSKKQEKDLHNLWVTTAKDLSMQDVNKFMDLWIKQ